MKKSRQFAVARPRAAHVMISHAAFQKKHRGHGLRAVVTRPVTRLNPGHKAGLQHNIV